MGVPAWVLHWPGAFAKCVLASQADRPCLRPLLSRSPTVRGVSPPTSPSLFRPRGAIPGSESHMEATPDHHTWSFALHFFLFSCQGSDSGGVPSLWPYHNMIDWKIHEKKLRRFTLWNIFCKIQYRICRHLFL